MLHTMDKAASSSDAEFLTNPTYQIDAALPLQLNYCCKNTLLDKSDQRLRFLDEYHPQKPLRACTLYHVNFADIFGRPGPRTFQLFVSSSTFAQTKGAVHKYRSEEH